MLAGDRASEPGGEREDFFGGVMRAVKLGGLIGVDEKGGMQVAVACVAPAARVEMVAAADRDCLIDRFGESIDRDDPSTTPIALSAAAWSSSATGSMPSSGARAMSFQSSRSSAMGWRNGRRGTAKGGNARVQWCHGAPGMIISLAALPADLRTDALLLAGGELTWTAGALRKGPGLCHGTAGNAYALLALHARTGDELWLTRARAFAMDASPMCNTDSRPVGVGATRYSQGTWVSPCCSETVSAPKRAFHFSPASGRSGSAPPASVAVGDAG